MSSKTDTPNNWTQGGQAKSSDAAAAMANFNETRQKINDAFGIGGVARAAGISTEPLRCYQVGDYDWFAATSPEQASELMREIVGDEDWDVSDYEVTLSSDELLDKRWREEDEPDKDAGSLREWLAEAKEPVWLNGIEP
ncbi:MULTISPECIES: hypothetical protein [Pseudomonas]|uniref:hypothetical protein n=1 Tax=Pseudomonas TaxID=286 RepID=UPI0021CC58D4|nr:MULTISPECIES: hypothetical protein [Pseudomonas]MEC4242254.1 hypothetical protein [Pseudomonas sp. DSV-1]